MIQVTIVCDNKWVLEHRNDDILPMEFLKSAVHGIDGILPTKTTLASLVLSVSLEEKEAKIIIDGILDLFKENYGIAAEELESIATVTFETLPDEEPEEKDEDTMSTIERLFALDLDEDKSDDGKKAEKPDGKCAVEECMKKIAGMTGGAEFKAFADELCKVAPFIKENKTFDTFSSQTYLFSINSGSGLSTYLDLMAQLIVALGVCPGFKKPAYFEYNIPASNGRDDPFEDELDSVFTIGDKDNVRLICIDLSEWIDATNHPCFKKFITKLPRQVGKYIFVFRVPFVEKDVLNRMHRTINDVAFVKGISFPPFTRAEIQSFANSEIERYGFRISAAAWPGFHERISEERTDGRFYGLNTVKKVVQELIYEKQLQSAKKGKNDLLITKKDTFALCSDIDGAGLSGYEMLDRLVCADQLKVRINEIVSQILLARKNEVDPPCIHMRFVGNPGTGKTTVARILGKILKEKGVLRIGGFFEYGGRDFCGRYIGETAPKTVSMCRDAYGSVLFIDEAYSLYRGNTNSNDYGREALDVLIAEMENHRSDIVVIMAGYPDEMKTLMEGNSGLASRMPYVIDFPNFDRDQLYEIYVSMIKRQFEGDEALFCAAKKFFDSIPDSVIESKEFSNARFVRNLYERTWAKATMRCQLDGVSEITVKKVDFDAATADKEFDFNTKKTVKIGF